MRLINFIRRICILVSIRSIEQHERDQRELMRTCTSADEYASLMKSNEATRRELLKARQEFNNLLPVGVRRTWKTA
jgi:hypothetical protein